MILRELFFRFWNLYLTKYLLLCGFSFLPAFRQISTLISAGLCALPLSLAYVRTSGAVGAPHTSVVCTHYIVDGHKHMEVSGTPTRTPTGIPTRSMWAIPFFNPLEAEFEKVVFTKNVALAMLYLVVFEN